MILRLDPDYSDFQLSILRSSRWLPSLPAYCLFSDYYQTNPNSQITPKLLPILRLLPFSNNSQTTLILRWLPNYSLLSDYSETTPSSEIIPRWLPEDSQTTPILNPFSDYTQTTLILRWLPHYSNTKPILRLLPDYSNSKMTPTLLPY